jgi:hypothetical protein
MSRGFVPVKYLVQIIARKVAMNVGEKPAVRHPMQSKVMTEGPNRPGLAEICRRFANVQWLPAPATREGRFQRSALGTSSREEAIRTTPIRSHLNLGKLLQQGGLRHGNKERPPETRHRLNMAVALENSVISSRKPFDALVEGLISKNSRGDWIGTRSRKMFICCGSQQGQIRDGSQSCTVPRIRMGFQGAKTVPSNGRDSGAATEKRHLTVGFRALKKRPRWWGGADCPYCRSYPNELGRLDGCWAFLNRLWPAARNGALWPRPLSKHN